jgi:predicted nucleotidyltransferase
MRKETLFLFLAAKLPSLLKNYSVHTEKSSLPAYLWNVLHTVILFGSRLCGTATRNSDYDFIVVVSDEVDFFSGPKLVEKTIKIDQSALENLDLLKKEEFVSSRIWKEEINSPGHLEEFTININVYHQKYFEFLLSENIIWVVMLLFVPSEFVWFEKLDTNSIQHLQENKIVNRRFSFQIRKQCLKKAVLMDCLHNFAKAKRSWTVEKNIIKGKKNLIHGLRYLDYSIELCKSLCCLFSNILQCKQIRYKDLIQQISIGKMWTLIKVQNGQITRQSISLSMKRK